jgi:hypothetical protein
MGNTLFRGDEKFSGVLKILNKSVNKYGVEVS